jgi:phosphoglycolate phosphatase
MSRSAGVSAVLFDLDGTLLDTAPDMVATLNLVLAEESRPAPPYHRARAHVSNGALGLLRLAFGELPESERARLQQRFLQLYGRRLAVETRLFTGMDEVLAGIENRAIPWGVVTNKPAALTEPLLERLGLRQRCACVVSGDTTSQRKPHPQPLMHALGLIPASPRAAIYVGDASRDIAAGRAAGVRTVAALYGYIPPEEDAASWGADHDILRPLDLMPILDVIAGDEPP